ncbi:MAG: DUF1501 domain-containing protein, partial [Verrucomicrobiota bacterium]
TRRGFMDRSLKIGLGVALSTLTDIPPILKRALAEGSIGGNGKKVLFIWLRGANDGLNSVIPVLDTAYASSRSTIEIPTNGSYSTTGGLCNFTPSGTIDPTFDLAGYAIALNNGFAGLHPSLKFLAPIYNAGELALIHRVGYAYQSRSHFDSQNYWENGTPNNKTVANGIFYRAMLQAILNNSAANSGLTGVSIQPSLPLILRGSGAAMTNLTDPTRYNLLGVPNTTDGNNKADRAIKDGSDFPFSSKIARQVIDQQYQNLNTTLKVFETIDFSESGSNGGLGNYFVDDTATDGDVPYYLFPTNNSKNGGANLNGRSSATSKYVVDTGAYTTFGYIKAAALILNKTDAIVAGTEFGSFDTHNVQGGATGAHANLQRRIAWAMYGLKKFFTKYGKGGTSEMPGAKVNWNDIIVVTLSEFGRTTKENGSTGTDHAEAGVMFVAGGGVKGYGKLHPITQVNRTSAVFCCGSGSEIHNGNSVPWNTGTSGSMFFGTTKNYLQRAVDYRSVLGEIIRSHLGATSNQLNTIIPGYANANERLAGGGAALDGTTIAGELHLI